MPLSLADVESARPIYVYEPNDAVLDYVERALRPSYAVRTFRNEEDLLSAMRTDGQPDITLMAWSPTSQRTLTLRSLLSVSGRSPVVLLSSASDMSSIMPAIEMGVHSVLLKPFSAVEVQMMVKQHLLTSTPSDEDAVVERETPLPDGTSFVRSSRRMRDIEAQAALIARSDIPVLILGESGTGKEILAKYTHSVSDRRSQVFLKVNCAAMPADLLESELFGYEQGAFTGAVRSKPGKFEIANGGTIFLDEIGDMPALLQAKLLHVLQDGTYSRLGSRSPMKADVRVIAATNINMMAAIADKSFREDLYYRLNGFSLTLPPLRARREEIGMFAHHFMQKGAGRFGRPPLPISNNLLNTLTNYSWPGNLREMENIINRYLVIGDEQSIIADLTATSESLPPQGNLEASPSSEVGLKQMMRSLKGDAESVAIANMLEETRWNRKAAAEKMKISYKALLYKIKQYQLAPPK